MKKRYLIWLIATIISAFILFIFFLVLSIWTIVLYIPSDTTTSLPPYCFVPFIVALVLGIIPVSMSFIAYIKKQHNNSLLKLSVASLIYLVVLLLIIFTFYFTKWNILSFNVLHESTLFSYLILVVICSIRPSVSCFLFKTKKDE